MSIAVLVQVYDEVRRLSIAGGAVAAGDFRLRKLVPPLEQAAAKAPVFDRVAKAAQAVVDSTDKTASAALLDLASLVNSILYTQGQTGITGDLTPLETTALPARATQTSARVLKPLLDALRSTGSGRIELVRDAIERGAFQDLRLVRPALNALDDPYPEIADVIAKQVLPTYGKAILPELRSRLDVKGRGGQLHRLRLLHALDPEGSRDLVQRALDEGSKEIRVVAIECLGTTGPDLACLLEQVKAKARDVRAAAIWALGSAQSATPEIIAALKRAIEGPDLDLIVTRLQHGTLAEVHNFALAQAECQLTDTLAATEPKKQGEAIARLQHFANSLSGRTDPKSEAFLLRCFHSVAALAKIKSTPSGQDFNELLVQILAQGSPKLTQPLIAAHKSLPASMLASAAYAARRTMSPAAFYNEFSPELAGLAPKRGKKGVAAERAEAIASVLPSSITRSYFLGTGVFVPTFEPADAPPPPDLDPRWLDTAIDAGAVNLVCELARPDHAKVNRFLSAQLADTKPQDLHVILDTMVRIGHPDAADSIIDALKKQAKSTHVGYFGYWFGPLIAGLPRKEYPKFEALLPTLPEKLVDQLMDSVLELKNKPE